MIPVRLTLEGLYSYQERQTIDFSTLTAAGLFGIFGATGSGKSAILEAIGFALYGETERLNAREKRSYNMMNLKSNRMYIAFDFLNHQGRCYRAERIFKRNSKQFEDIKPASSVFYEKKGTEWVPLDHVNAELLLDLSYRNFKRTIIIPQGQFREFLELGPADRTRMMKEIFNLERFELQEKASALLKETQDELKVLEGRLTGFEKVSASSLEEKEMHLKEANSLRKKIAEQYEREEKAFHLLRDQREKAQLLKADEKELKSLESQKSEISALETQLKKYELVFRLFHEPLARKQELEKDLIHQRKKLQEIGKEREEIKERYKTAAERQEKLKPQYDRLEIRKQKAEDYKILLELKKIAEDRAKKEVRMKKGEKIVKEALIEEEGVLNDLKSLEKEIENLKTERIDTHRLLQVSKWYDAKAELENKQKEEQQREEVLQEQIEGCLKKITEEYGTTEETFKTDFERRKEEGEKQKAGAEKALARLRIEQQLSRYALELKEGEPCPVCGSVHHSEIPEHPDRTEAISEKEMRLKELEREQKERNDWLKQVELELSKKEAFVNQRTEVQKEKSRLKETLKEHLKLFEWEEFDPQHSRSFEEKREKAAAAEKRREELENKRKEFNQKSEAVRGNLKRYQEELQKIATESAQDQTRFSTKKSSLKVISYEEFETTRPEEIAHALQQLNVENEQIRKHYEETEALLNELKNKEAGRKASEEEWRAQATLSEKRFNAVEEKIKKQVEENNLSSSEEVESLLAAGLETEKIRARIENFKVSYRGLKAKVARQREELKGYKEEEHFFLEEKKKFEELGKELEVINQKRTELALEYERLKEELVKKETLLEKQQEFQKRETNLKTIYNLMKGSGFVRYASSIYLRQLCDHANVRFHRMTRNQLSLRLDADNNFEVMDYLNEGKSRSVKTLSGGQSFQVSLSLALALAESVQAHKESDQNFFFIDEGFGTQDQASVNIVFDTLTQLRKEHRIVGIISHVEALKERIPVALNIEKDEGRGSLIRENF